MRVSESFWNAVNEKIRRGELSETEHMPIIEAAAKIAALMDEPEWPIVRGKIDNVSPAVFLKYCDALGIVPKHTAKKKTNAPKLAAVNTNKRFSKVKDA